jgi:transcriptional regulator with XRE-family HTH domain
MENTPQSIFCKNLKYLRKKQKLTQEELAGFIHVQRPVVGSWETGRNTPDLGRVAKIAAFFGVTIDALVTKDIQREGGVKQAAKTGTGVAEKLTQHEFLSKLNERLYFFALESFGEEGEAVEDQAEAIVLESWAVILKTNPEIKQDVEALELLLKSLIHIRTKKQKARK